MKKLLVLLVFTSVSLAQVDSVFTRAGTTYSGNIVHGNGHTIYLVTDEGIKFQFHMSLVSSIKLKSGKEVFGVGIPQATYYTFVDETFEPETDPNMEEGFIIVELTPSTIAFSDTIGTELTDPLADLSLDERSTVALERIALVQTIELGLTIVSVVLILFML